MILTSCRKLPCLTAGKKSTSSPYFSGDTAKICQLIILSTLGMPDYGHPKWKYQLVKHFDAYLHAKNTLHRSLWCLSACQKYTSSLTSFLRYYILPAIWLANSILARNWRTRILPDMRLVNNISFHFRLFPGKSNDKIFQRNLKKHSLGTFLDPFLPKFEQKWIFLENGLSVFIPIIYYHAKNV